MTKGEMLAKLFWHKTRRSWVEITAQDAKNRCKLSSSDLEFLAIGGQAQSEEFNGHVIYKITKSGMDMARKWMIEELNKSKGLAAHFSIIQNHIENPRG